MDRQEEEIICNGAHLSEESCDEMQSRGEECNELISVHIQNLTGSEQDCNGQDETEAMTQDCEGPRLSVNGEVGMEWSQHIGSVYCKITPVLSGDEFSDQDWDSASIASSKDSLDESSTGVQLDCRREGVLTADEINVWDGDSDVSEVDIEDVGSDSGLDICSNQDPTYQGVSETWCEDSSDSWQIEYDTDLRQVNTHSTAGASYLNNADSLSSDTRKRMLHARSRSTEDHLSSLENNSSDIYGYVAGSAHISDTSSDVFSDSIFEGLYPEYADTEESRTEKDLSKSANSNTGQKSLIQIIHKECNESEVVHSPYGMHVVPKGKDNIESSSNLSLV